MNKPTINLTFKFGVDPPDSLKPKTNQLHGMTSIRNDLFWQAAIAELQTRMEAIEAAGNGLEDRVEAIEAILEGMGKQGAEELEKLDKE